MSRRAARELLFKIVFEFTFNKVKNDDTLNLTLLDSSLDADDKIYISKSYDGIAQKFQTLSDLIAKHSKGFALERVYRPDFAVLLLGAYELLFLDEVPDKVAINEAVALSKVYGEEKSPRYVNGVLAGVLKEKNQGENK
jgi:N utilization substance protein B